MQTNQWKRSWSMVAILALTVPVLALAFTPDTASARELTVSDVEEVLDVETEPEELHAAVIWHTQSRGNRGEDVRTIQYLLRARGYSIGVDGIFGSGTESTVKSFQSSKGLYADGIVGSNTWSNLIITVDYGDSGDAVRAVQNLLNHKRGAGLAVDGVFGSGTYYAVRNFQSHMGLTVDGIVGPTTWKYLVWHYDMPNFGMAALCEYGDSGDAWGTSAAIGQLEAAARAFYSRGYGPMALGDVSLEHGGDIAGHASHEVGLDADLRPIRTDNKQCQYGTSYGWSSYDKYGTLRLCQDMRSKASGHVKVIWFNDPYVRTYCPANYLDNHSNHLHIRYCEKVHPDSRYDC